MWPNHLRDEDSKIFYAVIKELIDGSVAAWPSAKGASARAGGRLIASDEATED